MDINSCRLSFCFVSKLSDAQSRLMLNPSRAKSDDGLPPSEYSFQLAPCSFCRCVHCVGGCTGRTVSRQGRGTSVVLSDCIKLRSDRRSSLLSCILFGTSGSALFAQNIIHGIFAIEATQLVIGLVEHFRLCPFFQRVKVRLLRRKPSVSPVRDDGVDGLGGEDTGRPRRLCLGNAVKGRSRLLGGHVGEVREMDVEASCLRYVVARQSGEM